MAVANRILKVNKIQFSFFNKTNRLFSSLNKSQEKKGLILGIYQNKNESGETKIKLTPAAEKYVRDNNIAEKILKQINLGGPIKKNSTRLLWGVDDINDCIAIAGLGEENPKPDSLEGFDEAKESVREAVGAACLSLKSAGINHIRVEDLNNPQAAAEAAVLSTWIFQEYKSKSKRQEIPRIIPLCPNNEFERGVIYADAQNFARFLMTAPANLMTPTIFSEHVEKELSKYNIRIDAHDRKWIEDKKMGAFLSVTQGSIEEPVFLELTYDETGDKDAKPYVLVGKGVTFDSGGISIKPSANMDAMRADMGGGACVAATILAVAKLKLPVYIKGLIPLCENLPSGRATKPGDVVIARNGKSIAVDNTDAEGRLILADALCYAKEFDPQWVLDIATLTGAMVVAIGNAATGVFTNSSKLWEQLQLAAFKTGDRVWRFPLWKKYTKDMIPKDCCYDINNIAKGSSKGGGACTAAGFLREFAPENVDWAHLDMASVMDSSDSNYLAGGMTGRPTRTLVNLIERYASATKD